MYATKNAHIDKHGDHVQFFKNLFGNSFLFSKTDEVWKRKRKGLAHAFYKDKLIVQIEQLKVQISQTAANWKEQISKSPDGSIKINVSREILHIFERFLSHIVLGANLSDEKLTVLARKNDLLPFTEKESNLSGAVEEAMTQTVKAMNTRNGNPLWRLMNYLTGKSMAFTALERAADFNSAVSRAKIREFIRKRQSG